MPIYSSRAAKLLTAGVFALAVAATPAAGLLYSPPAAHAEGSGGVPVPQPVPVPEPGAQASTGETTSTIESGLPADLVPNINGDSCTGYWESTVCFAEQGQFAVQPKSTISSSP